MLLKDRVAIITGGAKGIGKGIALKFAEEGCSVTIADVLEKEGDETAKEVSAKGVGSLFVRCDCTDKKQVTGMVKKTVDRFGKITILVNNVGWFGPAIPLVDLSEEEWDRSVDLNLKSAFLCSQAAVPYMIKEKYGKIINIASIAAVAGGPSSPHYTSAKGGVVAMTLDFAINLAKYNICANSILPGTIMTDMWKHKIPAGVREADYFKQIAKGHIPLGRAGTPEDVGNVALFFASELSDYVTGEKLLVSGGVPLQLPPF